MSGNTVAGSSPSTVPFDESYVDSSLPGGAPVQQGEQKVLGVHWKTKDDSLIFDFRAIASIADELIPTKRNVISVIGRFYDPLGYMSPTTIQFKVYMQELCRSKLHWDESLTGTALTRWTKLVDQLRLRSPLMLPRRCISAPVNELMRYRHYGFCDASVTAYAAVVYLVEETTEGTRLQFVVCITRVSHIKAPSIHRLELLSVLLLSQILSNVSDNLKGRLPLQPPKCFTDSRVALYWITGLEKEWKPFVQNRVNEIREVVPKSSWSHCPGSLNPTDIPSRGVTAEEFSRSVVWRSGLDLSQIPEEMPCKQSCGMSEPCVVEMKAHALISPVQAGSVGTVIAIANFSTLHRTTAYVLKFIDLLNRKSVPADLTPHYLKEAEQVWVKECQLELEEDERFSTWRAQFGLFKDSNQIWTCGGRLQNTGLPFSTVHPILMDRAHPMTKLIITSAHRRVRHNGVKETLSEIRGKFWIIRGRSLVKQIIGRCVVCR